jgi:hypothetical protein
VTKRTILVEQELTAKIASSIAERGVPFPGNNGGEARIPSHRATAETARQPDHHPDPASDFRADNPNGVDEPANSPARLFVLKFLGFRNNPQD